MVDVRRNAVLESLRNHPHRRVLEIGCGLDPLFSHWRDFDEFVVVEPSKAFAEAALQKAKRARGVAVVRATLEKAGRELRAEGPFDFVIASSILHEVENPSRFLAAIRRLCSKETVVHLNVPNARSVHRLLALEMGLIESVFERSRRNRILQQSSVFDRPSLCALLHRHRFEVMRFGTYFVKPFSHAQMEALFDRRILGRRALGALGSLVKYMPELGAEMFVEARLAHRRDRVQLESGDPNWK